MSTMEAQVKVRPGMYRVVGDVTYRASNPPKLRIASFNSIGEYKGRWSDYTNQIGVYAPEGISINDNDVVFVDENTRTIVRNDGPYVPPPPPVPDTIITATIRSFYCKYPQHSKDFEYIACRITDPKWKSVVGVVPCALKLERGMQCRFSGMASVYERTNEPQIKLITGGVEVLSEDSEHGPRWVIGREVFASFTKKQLDALAEKIGRDWPEQLRKSPALLEKKFPRWQTKTREGIIAAANRIVDTPTYEQDLLDVGLTRTEMIKIEARTVSLMLHRRDPAILVRDGNITYKQCMTIYEKGKWFRDCGTDRGLLIILDYLHEARRLEGKTAVPMIFIRKRLSTDYRQTLEQVETTLKLVTDANGLEVVGEGKFAAVAIRRMADIERTIVDGVKKYAALISSPARGKSAVALDPDQEKAVAAALSNGVSIITGGPGTGKTYLCAEIGRLHRSPYGIAVAARTALNLGRRAKIRHLTVEQFRRRAMKDIRELSGDCLIVDEVSMINSWQMKLIMTEARNAGVGRIVLVGDVDQLPPIGAGNPFADLVASGLVPVARLTEIHRVDKGSGIARFARDVNNNEPDVLTKLMGNEYPDVTAHNLAEADAINYIVRRYLALLNSGVAAEDIGILSPFKVKKFGISSINLNEHIRAARGYPPDHPVAGDIVVGTGRNERRGYDRRTLLNGSRGVILDAEYGEDEWWLQAQFDCDELPTEWWCETKAAILRKAKQDGIEVVSDDPPPAQPLPAAVIGADIPPPPKPKLRALDPKTGLPS